MMQSASGEYGYDLDYFVRLLSMGAVDFLQADATRCGGFTGFFKVAALAEAFNIPLSSHCAPTLHVPLGCALECMKNLEYFYDHARIEGLFFDGWRDPVGGKLAAQRDRPGLGIEFKHRDADRFMMQ
jgi:L-alanine-DL-glutamate epimerase-like enolase superfamily enzyme